MKKIGVFENVSIDGCFAGPNGEIDWFKSIEKDEDFEAYTHGQSKGGSTLLFGRTTYEMMKSYWPTPQAKKADPAMAKVMNESPKVVISKTLKSVDDWNNVRVLDDINAVRALKEESDITILGSGSIVRQLANLGLIDEYQLVVVPLLLGAGKALFKDVKMTGLKATEARRFGNGVVVVRYAAAD
ncbi:MAG TPA: dihydrofolate reductase family protein [Thermoanaerobaculia bacterium]|nr:dihydrofolate reductase family protein [Thermoanaerobaculia bacterium]